MIFNMVGNGGVAMNFAVVGGTSRPTSPKENTIWIETSTAITGYSISPTAPASPAAGHVWITYSNAASAHFEAVRKSGVWVYPMMPRQYVSGAWVWRNAEIYQGGKWIGLYLSVIASGIPNSNLPYTTMTTGGATIYATSNVNGYLNFYGNAAGYHGLAFGPVDLTPFTILEYTGHASETQMTDPDWKMSVWSTLNKTNPRVNIITEKNIANTTDITVSLDITHVNQVGYVGVRAGWTVHTYIKDLILK